MPNASVTSSIKRGSGSSTPRAAKYAPAPNTSSYLPASMCWPSSSGASQRPSALVTVCTRSSRPCDMITYDHYPRDLIGYGPKPPHAQWPNGARVALQFVLNYEEGGENNVLHGDAGSETFLSEIIGAASFSNRHMSMESIYEYGSRAGLWRLLRMV